LPYPELDAEGQIVADDAWWATMQAVEPKKNKQK
ncbi:tRNA (guanosine(18)-2'-O)-methyltransferase TrmH, partial [Photobacterium damselae subsp. damselae]|nr:tRNA (guanosine(18)-2'-O)-methyltransferase TrmH [Photobacterium damselae subsp. damselae]